jgi:hypothetical protein
MSGQSYDELYEARLVGWLRAKHGIELNEAGADAESYRQEFDEWLAERDGDAYP